MKANTVIKADEDVMTFMNITDSATSDQSLLNGLQNKLPSGSCVTFDKGYVNYEARQSFTDKGIFYVTCEKKSCKKTVLSSNEIP